MTSIIYFSEPNEIRQFAISHNANLSAVHVQCPHCRMEQYIEMVMIEPLIEIQCQFCCEKFDSGFIIPDPTTDHWKDGLGIRLHLN